MLELLVGFYLLRQPDKAFAVKFIADRTGSIKRANRREVNFNNVGVFQPRRLSFIASEIVDGNAEALLFQANGSPLIEVKEV